MLQGPVVIVPTKYYKTPTQSFRDMGVSMVIWANHNLRASVKAMQDTTSRIYKDQSLEGVEPNVSGGILTTLLPFNSLQSNKILDHSKFKALGDDKINVTEKLKFVFGMAENILGKHEMLISSIFSFSQNIFERLPFQGR